MSTPLRPVYRICTWILTGLIITPGISPAQNWKELNKIVASDRAASDYFGVSVAISGNHAIVGAYQEDHDTTGANYLGDAGSAYIYERDSSNGNWGQAQKLVPDDRRATDYFGYTVAISGDYAIVGAYQNDYDTANANFISNAGAAYIFERDSNGVWQQAQKLVSSDRASSDLFGHAVAISGNYAVVATHAEDEDENGANTLSFAGSAYVFERDGSGVWNEVQKIVASDRAVNDFFGWSVGISDDHIIVGAYQEDEDASGSNTLLSAGSAYIFERDTSNTWNEVKKLVASDRHASDSYGYVVSISGNYAVIGAYAQAFDANGADSLVAAGSAYIVERDGGGNWNEVQKIVASDRGPTDFFGIAVAIDSNYIVSSAYQEDEDANGANTLNNAGSAYVFERDAGGTWNEVSKIVASDRNSSDNFGSWVGISGDYIISGAYYEDEDENGANYASAAGSAYIFKPCMATSLAYAESACDSFTVPSGNETYTSSGVYMDTIPNMAGCDSILTITLTILNTTTYAFSDTACDSYTVPSGDEMYTSSGVYMDTIPNMAGCDSVLTITLTILNSTTYAFSDTACDSYVVPSGDEMYTSSGVYMDTIPNMAGCDSILTITLTILNSTTYAFPDTACDSYVVPSGDEMYTSSGVYMDTIPNMAGCDSILTITLTILKSTAAVFNETACDSFAWQGVTYTTSGTYMDTITNVAGCDSVMTLNLVINNTTSATVTDTACYRYMWLGQVLTTSGTYIDTIPNAANCDSIITLNLTINTVDTSVTANDPTLTSNDTTATAWQWIDCNNGNTPVGGATSASFTPSVNGSYAVIVTSNGCTDTSGCYNIYTVGTPGWFGSDFRLFPNPTTGNVTLTLGQKYGRLTLTIRNVLGQVVASETHAKTSDIEFTLDGKPGLYIIQVMDDQGNKSSFKVFKE
ncbi:MAG: T9SS type A sorting domain-containing protein [Flavobacteriales bacterium]|nr:T9SS type A sorting domain-containing protein [Flavobacteriales bacterium]